jgi:hypothetical protein
MVVLQACDGQRAVAGIVKETERVLGANGLEDQVVGAMRSLVQLNVISV